MLRNATCQRRKSFITREFPQNTFGKEKKKKNNTSQPQLLVQLLPYLRTVYSNPVPSTTQVCRATDSFLFLVYVLCVPTQWQLD